MDPAVIDAINGPPGETPAELLKWLKALREAFVAVPDSTISRVAVPLQAAIGVLERIEQGGLSDAQLQTADEDLFGYVVQARGLALYAYLEEMNAVRNLVAKEVASLKPGTKDRKNGERLQVAYEQAIDALARAYNGLREGRFDELKAVVPVLEEVRKVAQELGAK